MCTYLPIIACRDPSCEHLTVPRVVTRDQLRAYMSKRHIFLTGRPGIGKSTLCQQVLKHAAERGWAASGFYTAEVRDDHGQRCGFDVITLDGLKGPLARVGKGRGPTVGKYTVDLNSFEKLALTALRVSASSSLLLIDEIGAMELYSRAFFPAVRAALDTRHVVVLGTLPAAKDGRVFREVAEVSSRQDVEVLTVTQSNRDQLVHEVLAKLQDSLQCARQGRELAG